MEQHPLYGVFVDLRKAFDTMDRTRCLKILRAYGVGPNMRRLIEAFWDHAVLTCRANGNYSRPFKAGRGVTQGGTLSPKLFNILIDDIVREWLRHAAGKDVIRCGITEDTMRRDRYIL